MNLLGKKDIQEIRNEIYLGKGYYVIRNYITPIQVDHIVQFWKETNFENTENYQKFRDLHYGKSDFSIVNKDSDCHYNFFWNSPKDAPTNAVAWQMQSVRNQIEGNPPDNEFLPHYSTPGQKKSLRYIASYRVIVTRNNGSVQHHADWSKDHSRLQASLILSEYGKDYNEGGLIFYDSFTDGNPVNISETENLKAGDLVFFRHSQKHGVDPIKKSQKQTGFMRIIMPQEVVDITSTHAEESTNKGGKTAAVIKSSDLLRDQVPDLESAGRFYYDHEIGQLMKIAIRSGLDPAHVYWHRGLWGRFHDHKDWQVDLLKNKGLLPHHNFLDLGCGILRLGMSLVEYLNDDKYCGVDAVNDYIELGHIYLKEVVKTDKKYSLLADHNFNFQSFKRKFKMAIAQSVFTHLSFEQIDQCFSQLVKVMDHGSKLFFTICVGQDHEWSVMYTTDTPMIKSYHEDLKFYEDLSKKYSFTFSVVEDHPHPSQQVCVAEF